jgi:hypothetical protein
MRLLLALVSAALITAACEEEPTDEPDGSASPTTESQQTPEPTTEATTEPSPAPTPAPAPVELSGVGQTATDAVTPPCSVCRVALTHSGSSNFAVTTFRGSEQDLMVNEIGAYQGNRPIFGEAPVVFDIDADGAWTIRIEGVGAGAQTPFSGRGDAISDLFEPPDSGPWEFAHDGQANFAVLLHCAGGQDLIQNEIGPVSGSSVVGFSDGPCLREVEADGNWSLTPR